MQREAIVEAEAERCTSNFYSFGAMLPAWFSLVQCRNAAHAAMPLMLQVKATLLCDVCNVVLSLPLLGEIAASPRVVQAA